MGLEYFVFKFGCVQIIEVFTLGSFTVNEILKTYL